MAFMFLMNKSIYGWFIEAKPITGAFTDLNYAINFVIYLLFLKQFRSTLFCKQSVQKSHAVSTRSTGVSDNNSFNKIYLIILDFI